MFFHTIPAPPLFAPAVSAAHLRPAPPRPPTECPQKIVYWLWILAIFYLEQKIVIKQGTLLQPYEDRVIGNDFLWKTKILHVVLHVIIDGMTLINLNALAPQWGVKYPNGPRRAPVLRMSEETALTIRHVLKLVLRIPVLNAAILGARAGCHHGYTLIQAMTMSISPTVFGVLLAIESNLWLTCVGVTNVVFMVFTALQLPTAYGYDDDLRRMYLSTEENSADKLLRIGAPAVFVAPFIVNVIVRNEFVSNYASAYLRLNQRILLGSNRTTKDAGVSLSRLQRSVVFAVGIASIANVNAVHNVFFSSVTRAGVSVETIAAAVTQFLLPCYLTMRHLSSAGKRGQGGFLRAAVYTRATLTMSFAALSAVFLDVCKYAAETTSDLDVWRVWLPQWLFVVACSHVAVPAPDAARAFAGVLADFAAARVVFLYLAPAGTPEPDQKTQIYALAAMYIAALHLFDVTSFLFETVASWLKVQAEKPSTPARASVASDPLGSYNLPPGHWKMEDYEIDPVKFKLVSKRSARGSEGKGYNLGPMRYHEGTPPKGGVLSTVEENEADGVAESAHTQTCRALGCDKVVNTSNSVTAGLKLCSDHLMSQTPFSTTGSQSMFCLSCRRVHSPPRCETCRITRGDHAETLDTSFAGDQPGDKPSSPEEFQNVESMTMYFKTNEGPVGAVSRFRGVVDDFGAQMRGSMLHAEVAARPGCTLLTVDVLARHDDDAESFVDGVNRDGDDFDDDGISRSLDAHAADSIDKLRSIGATHGLEGNLAFIVGHPVKGRSRTHRMQFGAGGAVRQSTPLSSAADAVHDPVFSPQLIEAIRRSHDPSMRMPVIRSDRYDCIDLPRAPEGYAYTLRCHGRYVPLLAGAAVELSPHHADHDRAIPAGHEMFRITPNNVEGLGFIELVTHDATAYTGRAGAGHEHGAGQLSNFVDPVMCIPVFITPDAILASELSRTIGRFAQLGDSPALFNLGVALNAPRDAPPPPAGGSWGSDCSGDSSGGDTANRRRLEEVCFHAATACAALGWAAAASRVITARDPVPCATDSPPRDAVPVGYSHGHPLAGQFPFTAAMSEGPDTSDNSDREVNRYTSTEPSDMDVYEDDAYFGSNRSVHGGTAGSHLIATMNTNAGIATLLRAACTSGDSNTVNAVIAAIIRHRGAAAVGALVNLGDNVVSGRGWTPLHACAFAMAQAACGGVHPSSSEGGIHRRVLRGVFGDVARQTAINEAVSAALSALVVSTNPLAWVTGNAGMVVGTPAEVSCSPPDNVAYAYQAHSMQSRRQRHAMKTASDKVVDVLASAVVLACDWLHRSLAAPASNPNDAENAARILSCEREHFQAALTLAANEYDGSTVYTIASALLLGTSSHLWEPMRRRVRDETLQGALGHTEAREWVLAGAPREGFAPPKVSVVVSGRHGVKSLPWIDLPVVLLVTTLHVATNRLGDVIWMSYATFAAMIVAAVVTSPPITPRRIYLRSHALINGAVRLLYAVLHPGLEAFMPSSYISRTRTTVRLMCICVHYVLQSLYAPVGMALEPVVMGAQALMFPGWGLAAKYVAAHTAGDAAQLAQLDTVTAELIVFVVAACASAYVASSSFSEHVARSVVDKQYLMEILSARRRGADARSA